MAANTNIDFRPLPELLAESVERYPEKPAIFFNGKTTSFAAFALATDAVAGALAARGVQKGDRIGLYCINSDVFAVAYFGIVKAGAVVVPINLLLNPREISFILNDAGVRGLVYADVFAPAVQEFRASIPGLEFAVCIGKRKAGEADVLFEEWMESGFSAPRLNWSPAEDLVAILYTSGTTGRPKGAMLTHRNLAANTWSVKEALRLAPGEDIFIVVLPMFHAFAATACMLFPLLYGCAMVPLPRFDPVQVAGAILAHRATHFLGVPSMYTSLLHLPEEHTPKLASLKYAISGGAALPVEVMKQFEERFGKLIYEGDGPTECSPVTCINPVGGLRKPASVGMPVPLVAMKILDEAGKEVPCGVMGEICVKGPNVMKGYWKLTADTAEAFFGDWFRTGDLGTEDEDGYFFIVDRKKDMIIVNGMNVYPRIIEEVLYRHPAIREAAVVGEPSELHGEIPVAFVTLKPDQVADANSLRHYCREHLGRHEIPRKFYFRPELPKNAAGKILKRELRKQGEHERG
ncbi:MAG: long-chain fatty acid--CoA ligase, partial [Lentisphaerota bacterium]